MGVGSWVKKEVCSSHLEAVGRGGAALASALSLPFGLRLPPGVVMGPVAGPGAAHASAVGVWHLERLRAPHDGGGSGAGAVCSRGGRGGEG